MVKNITYDIIRKYNPKLLEELDIYPGYDKLPTEFIAEYTYPSHLYADKKNISDIVFIIIASGCVHRTVFESMQSWAKSYIDLDHRLMVFQEYIYDSGSYYQAIYRCSRLCDSSSEFWNECLTELTKYLRSREDANREELEMKK